MTYNTSVIYIELLESVQLSSLLVIKVGML